MIFKKFKLGNYRLQNKVVLPPMVRFSILDKSSYVNQELINYYKNTCEARNGLIIVEATAVSSDGKLRDNQIGIWDDSFIEGLSKIAKLGKEYNIPMLLQLHHAGFREKIKDVKEEILDKILDDFVNATIRAKKAGFNGIEIHGAHRYLISQLHSKIWNTRDDKYGGNFQKRMYFITEYVNRTKELFNNDFLLGIRIGGNEPGIEEGIEIAKYLEKLGFKYLHISHGIPYPNIKSFDKVEKPEDFPLNWINYLSFEIKRNVKIPVIAVYEIKKYEQAKYIIDNNGADLIAVGRAQLNNFNLLKKWHRKEKYERSLKWKKN
ncbi:2,4-dienoyl-CoA reductase-like NADH-dependent reductase (Old Yellow Enzyme family) [Hypnocyclicus thermotrophus]|uniref:2,4-dienoyl-CoA reductase-like NADH-dependent reductase (Old Yellow Enzyme family) n=1 Tax=Hypnocyclicus thermotrophus TaxID=1627895 RepID=A0AA46E081_9FUSO|nr:NADH:flavin oxidoreductase [Hypnocyclicus thermotrophus]TDT72397.1 2,4-dienoyl-CoA reductase-like NADH-dependent reductase (Old Yellow Enzyme family) [Hypnocyclicus thermotrophus]